MQLSPGREVLLHWWNVLVRAGHLGVGEQPGEWSPQPTLHCLAADSTSRRTGHPLWQLQLQTVTRSLRGWRGTRTHPQRLADLMPEANPRRATATRAKVTRRGGSGGS